MLLSLVGCSNLDHKPLVSLFLPHSNVQLGMVHSFQRLLCMGTFVVIPMHSSNLLRTRRLLPVLHSLLLDHSIVLRGKEYIQTLLLDHLYLHMFLSDMVQLDSSFNYHYLRRTGTTDNSSLVDRLGLVYPIGQDHYRGNLPDN